MGMSESWAEKSHRSLEYLEDGMDVTNYDTRTKT